MEILGNIFDYENKKNRLLEINKELESSKIWKKPTLMYNFNKEKKLLEKIVNSLQTINIHIKNCFFLLKLLINEKDLSIENEILTNIQKLKILIKNLEFFRMFSKKHDKNNCYMDIQAGSGGIEAQDWAKMLLRMYIRWAHQKSFHTEIIDKSQGDHTGIKAATIKIVGEYAFGWLRTETGIHRLVRKSPFDSNSRRHTSFSSIFVYPNVNNDIIVKINNSDLRIDVFRASGAGGQHVNRTESAVRITHVPTNTVTQCQNNRSQHKNKEQAMKQMIAKIYAIKLKKQKKDKKILESNKSNISWGSQIRSYILDNARIKDLRTGIETKNVQSVLDGNLDKFIEANLKAGL